MYCLPIRLAVGSSGLRNCLADVRRLLLYMQLDFYHKSVEPTTAIHAACRHLRTSMASKSVRSETPLRSHEHVMSAKDTLSLQQSIDDKPTLSQVRASTSSSSGWYPKIHPTSGMSNVRERGNGKDVCLQMIFVWSTVSSRKSTKTEEAPNISKRPRKYSGKGTNALPNNEKNSGLREQIFIHPTNRNRIPTQTNRIQHLISSHSTHNLPIPLPPNRPLKMPIPITSNQPLAPPTPIPIPARNQSPFSRNLIHKIPHRDPPRPLNRLAPATPPAPNQVQRRARRLREVHSAPGSGGVGCCWVCCWWGWEGLLLLSFCCSSICACGSG